MVNDGLKVADTAEAAKLGDLIIMLAPDQLQASIYEESIRPNLEEGNVLMFAHGSHSLQADHTA